MDWLKSRQGSGAFSTQTSSEGPRRIRRTDVLVPVATTAAVWLVNDHFILLRPLLWLATFVHEAGHAAAAMTLGMDVNSVTINPHGGGLTSWSGRPGTFDTVVIGSAGYVGAALLGAGMLELCKRLRRARAACLLVAAVIAAVGAFWVPWSFHPSAAAAASTRSASGDGRFTLLFCAVAILLFGGLALQPSVRLRRTVLLVVATALCLVSVESLKFVLNLSSRGGHSDASAVAAVTPLSSWMWSAIWLLFGVAACLLALWSVLAPENRHERGLEESAP